MAMSTRFKRIVRQWVPQGLRDIYNVATGQAIVFEGVFDRWQEAERSAEGYAENSLFQHIEAAALSVKVGKAAWEPVG